MIVMTINKLRKQAEDTNTKNNKMGMRSSCSIMLIYVPLMIALVLMVGDSDEEYSCYDDLYQCYDYVDSDMTPADDCCKSMREATANQFNCLCSLNSSDKIIHWMNFTQPCSPQGRRRLEDLSTSNSTGIHNP